MNIKRAELLGRTTMGKRGRWLGGSGRVSMRAYVVLALFGVGGCAGPRMSTSVAPPHALLARAEAPGLRLAVDEAAREVVVDMGPFEVPDMGYAAHAGGSGVMPDGTPATHGHAGPLMPFEWPVEGWLRGFQVRVTDAEGNELPRRILHHLIGVNFDRRQLAYPALERFFGIGTETEDVELPSSIGVPMAEGQQLAFYASLHNDTGVDLHRVYVRVAMDYTPRASRDEVTEVLPVYFDTDNRIGDSNMWDVHPGRSERAWEFTVPVSGGLLGVTGHLHDYGEHVRIEDAATGRVLVKLDGRRDEAGRLEAVETRIFRKWLGLRSNPLRLEAGRPYRIVGVYDSPLEETVVDGAMAHIVGIFAPDDMSLWPALDPDSEWVRLDLSALPGRLGENGQGTPDGEGGHGGHHH
jgi:hypothetical protein